LPCTLPNHRLVIFRQQMSRRGEAMAAAVARIRVPTESSSAAGATSRTRTHSHCGSDGDPAPTASLPQGVSAGGSEPMLDQPRAVVDRLEALQADQKAPHIINPELDLVIKRALAAHPEWRQKMAVLTKSALLRQRILGASVQSRSTQDERGPLLSGGGASERRGFQTSDKVRVDPTLTRSQSYTFGLTKAPRFPGTNQLGMIDKFEVQKRGSPGPGEYFKTVPNGSSFSVDGGESIVLGANSLHPWKGCLGNQINPVPVDGTTLTAQPKYSFSKSRRVISETSLGHAGQDGGPVKSDQYCLSPGPVYEHYSSFSPSLRKSVRRRRSSSTPGSTMRMEIMPRDSDECRFGETPGVSTETGNCRVHRSPELHWRS